MLEGSCEPCNRSPSSGDLRIGGRGRSSCHDRALSLQGSGEPCRLRTAILRNPDSLWDLLSLLNCRNDKRFSVNLLFSHPPKSGENSNPYRFDATMMKRKTDR